MTFVFFLYKVLETTSGSKKYLTKSINYINNLFCGSLNKKTKLITDSTKPNNREFIALGWLLIIEL